MLHGGRGSMTVGICGMFHVDLCLLGPLRGISWVMASMAPQAGLCVCRRDTRRTFVGRAFQGRRELFTL